MASLFLDTSNKITFGILGENLEWLRFQATEDKKASKALHSLIQEELDDLGIELSSIEQVFYLSGPGSYTGVRVAQGFAEILQWQGIPVYSCRHFDIPFLLGHENGLFVSKAFKQEVFLYKWTGEKHEQKLMDESAADELIKELVQDGVPCFTSELDFYKECQSTYDLLEKEPTPLFSKMKKLQMKSEVFYYRDLEDEFSKGK